MSSESPRAAANLSEPSSAPSAPGVPAAAQQSAPPGPDDSADAGISGPGRADFGANEWMVDELYQRYLADPSSVDRAWWSFFADYRSTRSNATGSHPALSDGDPAEALAAQQNGAATTTAPPASTGRS
ncbi:MAG: 2-oxoglutarate dehydrogenase E1 subunit family protein, partial [Trebonia sp.]